MVFFLWVKLHMLDCVGEGLFWLSIETESVREFFDYSMLPCKHLWHFQKTDKKKNKINILQKCNWMMTLLCLLSLTWQQSRNSHRRHYAVFTGTQAGLVHWSCCVKSVVFPFNCTTYTHASSCFQLINISMCVKSLLNPSMSTPFALCLHLNSSTGSLISEREQRSHHSLICETSGAGR